MRSIKLLDKMDNPDEPVTRDVWWNRIRTNVKAHASSLGFSLVVGYSESTSISDNLLLLSATGTAAELSDSFLCSSRGTRLASGGGDVLVEDEEEEDDQPSCHLFHLPLSEDELATPCQFCGAPETLVPNVYMGTGES